MPLELVEETMRDLKQRFNLSHVVADQWQMHGSIERLRIDDADRAGDDRARLPEPDHVELPEPDAFGRYKCFPHPDLEAQLGSVLCKETFYGVRIDSGAGLGAKGRDDIVIAVAMSCQLAIEKGGGQTFLATGEANPPPPVSQTVLALRRRKSAALAKELAATVH